MSGKAARFASATVATNNIGNIINNTKNVDSHTVTEIPISRVLPDPKNNRKNTLNWDNPSEIDPDAPNARQLQAELDSLLEMADSINMQGVGLIQPIVVTRRGDSYNMVSGHRRLLACKLAGRTTVPAIVRVDLLVRLTQFIENVQRKNIEMSEGLIGVQGILEEIGIVAAPRMPPSNIANALIGDCKMSKSTAYRWANLLTSPEPLVEAVKDGLVTTWTQIEEFSKLPEEELFDQIALLSIYAGSGTQDEEGNAGDSAPPPAGPLKKTTTERRPRDFVALGKVRNTEVIKEVIVRVLGSAPEGVNWSDLKQVEKAFKKMIDEIAEKLK